MNVPLTERMKSIYWFTVAIVPKTTREVDESSLFTNYTNNLDVIVKKLVHDFEILHKGRSSLCMI